MCSEEKEAPLLLSVPLAAVSLFVLVILASFESVSVHLFLLLSEVDGGGLPGQFPAVQVPSGHPHLPLCL